MSSPYVPAENDPPTMLLPRTGFDVAPVFAEPAPEPPAADDAPASAPEVTRVRPTGWPVAVLVGFLATYLSWFRLPGEARDTIWAEDGAVFLKPWAAGTGWSSILQPYDGYLHVVPRLLGGLTYAAVDVDSYAMAVVLLCCAGYGVIAGLVYALSRDVVTLPAARVALALVTVLAPVAGWESMHNLANLHWFLLWLTPWLLLARPRSVIGTIGLSLIALLIGLSEIQAAVFVPLVLWLVVTDGLRKRSRWPVFGAFAVGLIGQGISFLTSDRVRAPGEAAPWPSTVNGYLLNTAIPFFDSRRSDMSTAVVHLGWIVGAVALVPFALALLAALWRGDRAIRTAALALALASMAVWVVAFVVNRDPNYFYAQIPVDATHPLTLVRWGTTSQMFLIALLPLGVAALAARYDTWLRLAPATMIAVVAVMATSLVQEGHPRGGTPWHDAVANAEATCTAEPNVTISVPIQPTNWFLDLPCQLLLSEAR